MEAATASVGGDTACRESGPGWTSGISGDAGLANSATSSLVSTISAIVSPTGTSVPLAARIPDR